MADELVRMALLGVMPRLHDDIICPFCGEATLELVVGWSTPLTAIEIEVGACCDRPSCDTFFLEGPQDYLA